MNVFHLRRTDISPDLASMHALSPSSALEHNNNINGHDLLPEPESDSTFPRVEGTCSYGQALPLSKDYDSIDRCSVSFFPCQCCGACSPFVRPPDALDLVEVRADKDRGRP